MLPIAPYQLGVVDSLQPLNQTCPIPPSASLLPSSFESTSRPLTGQELSQYFHWRAGPGAAAFVTAEYFHQTLFGEKETAKPLKKNSALKDWLKGEGFSLTHGINERQHLSWFLPKVTPLQQAIIKGEIEIVDQLLKKVTSIDSQTLLMDECLYSPALLKKLLDAKKTTEDEMVKVLDAIAHDTFTPSSAKLLPHYSEGVFEMLHEAFLAIPTDSPRIYHLPMEMLKRLAESFGMYTLQHFIFRQRSLKFSDPVKEHFGKYTAAWHAASTRDYDILKQLIRLGSPLAPKNGRIKLKYCPFYQIVMYHPDDDIIDFMAEEALKRGHWEISYLIAVSFTAQNEDIAYRLIEKQKRHDRSQFYQLISNESVREN